MNSDQVFALIGACLLAFIVRVFNVVVEWLSRVLGVEPPEPIPTAHDVVTNSSIDHRAPSVIDSGSEAPDPDNRQP